MCAGINRYHSDQMVPTVHQIEQRAVVNQVFRPHARMMLNLYVKGFHNRLKLLSRTCQPDDPGGKILYVILNDFRGIACRINGDENGSYRFTLHAELIES